LSFKLLNLILISLFSSGVLAQEPGQSSVKNGTRQEFDKNQESAGSFDSVDLNELDDTNSLESSDEGAIKEQELFDQLDTLNFEEAGFYESYKSFIYAPSGRNSPFEKPAALQNAELFNKAAPEKALGAVGLKAYDVQALRVTSLIWDVNAPRALVLDPSGQSHRVVVGTEIGRNDGYVAKIREGELVVIEKQKVAGDDGKDAELFRTQVLKMAR